jgi:cell division protein FtsZ
MANGAYKRGTTSAQQANKARKQADPLIESEAISPHSPHILSTQAQQGTQPAIEQVMPGWEQRNTDNGFVSSPEALEAEIEIPTPHHVDIAVVGVGGGGMNAINRMINTHVRGVRFIALNTDAQVLSLSQASVRICLGQHHTKGLGAGGNAATGMRAATDSSDEIREALGDADLVFIAAGMGGGTGTGAAPVVASLARRLGALTVGIVTLPFTFEGSRRRRIAEQGLAELGEQVDALITIPNDRLLSTDARTQNLSDAFQVADDVLRQGVQGIAEVINVPGMINVDFADVRSVLRDAGTALMSIGQGSGKNRAQQAAEEAIAGGFLNVTIRGAQRVLFNISGGEDMTLFEINEVAECIGSAIDDAADIIFGAVIDPKLTDTMRVTLIAAGMEELHTGRLDAVRPYSTQQSSPYSQYPYPTPRYTPLHYKTPYSNSQDQSPASPPPTRMPPSRSRA